MNFHWFFVPMFFDGEDNHYGKSVASIAVKMSILTSKKKKRSEKKMDDVKEKRRRRRKMFGYAERVEILYQKAMTETKYRYSLSWDKRKDNERTQSLMYLIARRVEMGEILRRSLSSVFSFCFSLWRLRICCRIALTSPYFIIDSVPKQWHSIE